MQLYNTLTAEKQPLQSLEPGHLRLYVCGPTPYDYTHLGHARCYVVYDVLVRHLRSTGLKVTYVRNITDVNESILKRADEKGEEPLALAERFRGYYAEDMDRLGNVVPDVEPKVSEHIEEIKTLIGRLIERGHAYASEGDVYFHVPSLPDYGKLSKRKLEDLEAGASGRTDDGETARKKNAADFALWKASAPEVLGWDSPWGRGQPGWHIECSAMGMKHLGECFDLHGGGLDLVFPHHENEIAQSEAATGKTYCGHWMHNGFVQVNKEKMSKSLGNFFTAREVFEIVDPEAVRYALLSIHYRAPFNLDWDTDDNDKLVGFPTFDEAERRLEYIYKSRLRLAAIPDKRKRGQVPAPREIAEFRQRLVDALDDDLNTPIALAAAADFLHAVNQACDGAMGKKGKVPRNWVTLAEDGFAALADVLGAGGQDPETFLERVRDRRAAARGIAGTDVEVHIAERKQARADKDFERADAIRDELLAKGVALLDTPEGTSWELTN